MQHPETNSANGWACPDPPAVTAALFCLVAGAAEGWAATTQIAGAVIATGIKNLMWHGKHPGNPTDGRCGVPGKNWRLERRIIVKSGSGARAV